jgi:pantoate--beta-alanine ligase
VSAEAAAKAALLEAGFNSVDYVAIRDAETLEKVETLSRPARVLAAAKVGATRLIDNREVV